MQREEIHRRVDDLVERYRQRCLWFLRPDYVPDSDEARLRLLDQIQRNGDREAFIRAGEVKEWLSRTIREESAAS